MVKMDKSFTLCEPKIECETGALKNKKQKKTKKRTRLCDKRLYENGLGG